MAVDDIQKYKLPEFSIPGNWRGALQRRTRDAFDDEKKGVYLQTLAKTGKYVLAEHAANVNNNVVRAHRKKDPEFDECVDIAKNYHTAHSVAKIEQDAVEGHLEQYFDKDTGAITRERRVFETKLREMILRAKAEDEYTDKKQVDIGVAKSAMGVIPGVVSLEFWEGLADELDESHEKMLDEGTEDSQTEDP